MDKKEKLYKYEKNGDTPMSAERGVHVTPVDGAPMSAEKSVYVTPVGGTDLTKLGSKMAQNAVPGKTDVANKKKENNATAGNVPAINKSAYVNSAVPSAAANYYNQADSMQSPIYESQYDEQISDLVDRILNGEKFSYDVNEDALFANYSDIYERNARKAAEDAMGRASAASGGYGSSYAAAAASQQYNSQMQGLNEVVPQLQQLAYEQYLANRQDEYNQLSTIKGLEDSAYSRHRDNVADYNTERDYMIGMGDRMQEQSNWQAEYDASRIDSDRNYQLNVDQFEHDKDMDNKAHELDVDQFEHDKAVDDRAQNLSEAVAAAEHGDYSLLEWYTGADLTDAKEWEKIKKSAEMYSATGLVSFLKDAGIDTTYLEDKIADEDYSNQLAIGLSVYEATGSPAMLQKLGIDTSYMDKILSYTLKEAENSANGSSGGSGGRSYSGDSSVVTSGSNDSYSEPAIWGDKTAGDIAAEIAYFYRGKGVAWNSRTVDKHIIDKYPGLSVEEKKQVRAYLADIDSGLEELLIPGMDPR